MNDEVVQVPVEEVIPDFLVRTEDQGQEGKVFVQEGTEGPDTTPVAE